jgi:hypothetical protein
VENGTGFSFISILKCQASIQSLALLFVTDTGVRLLTIHPGCLKCPPHSRKHEQKSKTIWNNLEENPSLGYNFHSENTCYLSNISSVCAIISPHSTKTPLVLFEFIQFLSFFKLRMSVLIMCRAIRGMRGKHLRSGTHGLRTL